MPAATADAALSCDVSVIVARPVKGTVEEPASSAPVLSTRMVAALSSAVTPCWNEISPSIVTSPSAGVFSSSTIFMFDGTRTLAPATGLPPPQVAGSDHSITVLGGGSTGGGTTTGGTTTTGGGPTTGGGVTTGGGTAAGGGTTTGGGTATGGGTTIGGATTAEGGTTAGVGVGTGMVATTGATTGVTTGVTAGTPAPLDPSPFGVVAVLGVIVTGPLAPAETAPGALTMRGLPVTGLPPPIPGEPDTVTTAGIAELLPPFALPPPPISPLPPPALPPPPPQAEIKTDSNA